MTRSALLLCAALAAFTAVAGAQGRERTLFVSAVDGKGEPVDGLGPDAFIVRENNQRREIKPFLVFVNFPLLKRINQPGPDDKTSQHGKSEI